MPRPTHEPEKQVKQEEVPVLAKVCKYCTETTGVTSPQVKDKKRVHTCQVCRVELLPKYAERLPEIKAGKPKV